MKVSNRFKTTAVMAAFCGFAMGCSTTEPVPDEEPPAEAVEVEETEEEVGQDVRAMLEAAAEGDHRQEGHADRNQYRNPVETLLFFGLEPTMTVVELWPGMGWYTEVLAPVLAEEGQLVVGVFALDEEDPEAYRTRIGTAYLQWLQENSDALGPVQAGTFDPPNTANLGEPESADMVVTFRNMHSLYNGGHLEAALNDVFEVLKPGGVFGVVTHRAPEGSDVEEVASTGYLPQEFVIEVVEAAGFVLDETSEINANPADTADHEHGVWSLPPGLRGGEEDAERFREIGESDRMTLRFVKPE